MSERLALYAEGLFDDAQRQDRPRHHPLRPREVVAVLDSTNAGRRADEVVPYCAPAGADRGHGRRGGRAGRDRLVIGVAPIGGTLHRSGASRCWRRSRRAWTSRPGLHTVLADDPDLVALAGEHGRRAARPARRAGRPRHADGPTSATRRCAWSSTVGSDCAIGKMSVTLELDARGPRARRAQRVRRHRPDRHRDRRLGHRRRPRDLRLHRGRRRAAGRTRAPSAATCCSSRARARSATPAYSGVTLGLLHGAAPGRAACSATSPGRPRSDYYETVEIPPLAAARRRTTRRRARRVRPARVAADRAEHARDRRRAPRRGRRSPPPPRRPASWSTTPCASARIGCWMPCWPRSTGERSARTASRAAPRRPHARAERRR